MYDDDEAASVLDDGYCDVGGENGIGCPWGIPGKGGGGLYVCGTGGRDDITAGVGGREGTTVGGGGIYTCGGGGSGGGI